MNESGPDGFLPLLRSLWRLIRGEDQRGRKVRWLLTLLRPYRKQVAAMSVGLLVATGAALAPPALVGLAVSEVGSDNASLADFLRSAGRRPSACLTARKTSRLSSASSMISNVMPMRRWMRSRNRSTLRASRTALVATARTRVTS